MTTAFHEQFPEERLEALYPNTADRMTASDVFSTSALETWSSERLRAAKRINDEAKEDIAQARGLLDRGQHPAMRTAAIGHTKMWVINYHQTMLQAVDLIFPTLNASVEGAIALEPKEKAEKERAAKLRDEVASVIAKVSMIEKAIKAAHKKKVAAVRFPKTKSLKDAGAKKALGKEFGVYGKPVRYGTSTGWGSALYEARRLLGRWRTGTFRYMDVWLATKIKGGR